MMPVLVRGMWGLGDNIYSRPFVRALAKQAEIWLDTPWPELYADLDIKFVQGSRRLRTQQKNIARQPRDRWSIPPPRIREIRISYSGVASIVFGLELSFGVGFDPALFDLPDMGPSPVKSERPIAIIRPATVRTEWYNEARNPRPEYIAQLATSLMDTHHVVAVADLEPGFEWLSGKLPPAHQYLVNGELNIRQLLALVREANVVVGGVGWIVPVGLVLKVPTFILLGGNGGYNAPNKITDRRLNLERLGFAMPDKFCQCTRMDHGCDKRMADPLGQFSRWRMALQTAA